MLSLDLDVQAGAFRLQVREDIVGNGCTGVFGPSGSGKTTLLRAIAGFGSAAGRIAWRGETWLDSARKVATPSHRRRIGYVFQRGALFPHLDVEGNLRYPQRRLGNSSETEYRRVVEALDLGALQSRPVQGLSGGETQRVALGRALLCAPQLLLLDEPLAALDNQRKIEILPFLARVRSGFGVPMLYVTHSVDELVRLADRVLVLSGGQVTAHGETAEVLERLDVQSVTGRFEGGSVIRADVMRHDPERFLTVLRVGTKELTMPILDRLPVGEAVRLRIRSRDVALATAKPRDISIRNIVPARIIEITAEPASAYAEVLLEFEGMHLRSRITRDAVMELGLSSGLEVFALIKGVTFDHRVL